MTTQRSFYDVLEIGREASVEEVRGAFRRLARERHPDLFQGPARERAEHDFQAITEAYNVLSEPKRRSRYDQSLVGGAPQRLADPRDVARALLAKAVGLAKAGETAQAAELFIQAVAHDGANPKARHLYGMFLAQIGRVDDGLRQLDQAMKLEPNDWRIFLDASRLFARARMFARATRLGQMAAQLSLGDAAVESWLSELRDMASRNGGRS
jgi:curved DNA-binding protein CbpA